MTIIAAIPNESSTMQAVLEAVRLGQMRLQHRPCLVAQPVQSLMPIIP